MGQMAGTAFFFPIPVNRRVDELLLLIASVWLFILILF